MSEFKNPELDDEYITEKWDALPWSNEKVKILGEDIQSCESYQYEKIKNEIVLRHAKRSSSYCIVARYSEISKNVFNLSIQRYTKKSGSPHKLSMSFTQEEIEKLFDLICDIQLACLNIPLNLKNRSVFDLSDEQIKDIGITKKQLEYLHHKILKDSDGFKYSSPDSFDNTVLSAQSIRNLFNRNPDLITEVVKSKVTTEDIVAVGYRKKQLGMYLDLLEEDEVNESVWQQFFERNSWIFGYGLGYVFLSNLDDKKLEQVVQGYSVNEQGKRVDALMKTKGLISNLCFVEIKKNNTDLLKNKPYRAGCWAVSKELAGAVAQVQGTVASAIENLSNEINLKDKEGNPTNEDIFNYQPKSYLVIGSLNEFLTEHGVNKDKLRSFELFRKNISSPEIITFDELYERASFIVRHNQNDLESLKKNSSEESLNKRDVDIPF